MQSVTQTAKKKKKKELFDYDLKTLLSRNEESSIHNHLQCSLYVWYSCAAQHTARLYQQLTQGNVNHMLAQIGTIYTEHEHCALLQLRCKIIIITPKKWCLNTWGNEWPNMLHTLGSPNSHLFHHPRDSYINMHKLYERPDWHNLFWQVLTK